MNSRQTQVTLTYRLPPSALRGDEETRDIEYVVTTDAAGISYILLAMDDVEGQGDD